MQRVGLLALLALAAAAVACRGGSTRERPAVVQTASPTASPAPLASTSATRSETGPALVAATLACGPSGSVIRGGRLALR